MTEKVLVLRTCKNNMTSRNGFQWPDSGYVECPDWRPTKRCGNGLHGWLFGKGNLELKTIGHNIWWLVVEVNLQDIIDLGDGVKFSAGNVVGKYDNFPDAMNHIIRVHPKEFPEYNFSDNYYGYAMETKNYKHASTTGIFGHTLVTGISGHASADGNYCKASTTGSFGVASATGVYGQASGTGISSWAISNQGKAMAGEDGIITIRYYSKRHREYRVLVGYTSEDIKPNTWYRVENDKLKELP